MKKITLKGAIYEAIAEEMKLNTSTLLVGYGVGNLILAPQPDIKRVIDLPVNGESAVRTAMGLAMTGARVILWLRGEYLLRCFEALAADAALTEFMYAGQYGSNITVVADTGYAPLQSPQLNTSFEAAFAAVPGLSVVYPGDAYAAKGLLRTAIQTSGAVLVLYARSGENEPGEIPESYNLTLPIGKAHQMRSGKDVSVITYGAAVGAVARACERAAAEGIECDAVDLCSLAPLDKEAVFASVKKTNKVIIVHEAHEAYGVGAEVAASIASSEAFFYLDKPIERVCAADAPVGYAKDIYEKVTVTENNILHAIRRMAAKEE